MFLPFFEIFRIATLLLAGVLLAETIGPLWHIAKHKGWLGKTFREQHIRHHVDHYPSHRVIASAGESQYLIAGEWNMYVLAGIVVAGIFFFLPLESALPVALGAAVDGVLTDYAHRAFHLKRNPLDRFQWYKTLARLHRIHHQVWGNFGVLFFLIDRLYGTLRFRGSATPEDLFPGYSA